MFDNGSKIDYDETGAFTNSPCEDFIAYPSILFKTFIASIEILVTCDMLKLSVTLFAEEL